MTGPTPGDNARSRQDAEPAGPSGRAASERRPAPRSRRSGARLIVRLAWALLAGFLLIYAVFFVIRGVAVLTFPYPINYGEGAVLATAQAWRSGVPLYRDPNATPFRSANYGPLAYLAPASVPVEASFAAGRLVSLVATVFIAIGLAGLSRGRWPGIVLGGLWLTLLPVYAWSALAKPDLAALALSLWGLRLAGRYPLLAGLLLSGAVLTKGSALIAVAALAAGWWLERRSGRADRVRWPLVAFTTAILALAIAAWELGSGGWFIRRVFLLNLSVWSGDQGASAAANYPRLFWPILLASSLAAFWTIRQRKADRWLAYWILAMVVATAGVAKSGADLNYYLEPLLASLALIGLAWSETRGSEGRRGLTAAQRGRLAWAGVGLLLIQLVLSAHIPFQAEPLPTPGPTERRQAGELVARLRAQPGLWLTEESGWLLAAGLPVWLDDPFYFTQLARARAWNPANLIDPLAAGEFSGILLDFDPGDSSRLGFHADRFTADMLSTLNRTYRESERIGGHRILTPASEERSGSQEPSRPGGATS